MELTLNSDDLLPRHRKLNTSAVRFAHFKDAVQAAVLIVGRAQYVWRDTYNAILPPNVNQKGARE